jgi:hypothetical protein
VPLLIIIVGTAEKVTSEEHGAWGMGQRVLLISQLVD